MAEVAREAHATIAGHSAPLAPERSAPEIQAVFFEVLAVVARKRARWAARRDESLPTLIGHMRSVVSDEEAN